MENLIVYMKIILKSFYSKMFGRVKLFKVRGQSRGAYEYNYKYSVCIKMGVFITVLAYIGFP
jgi:hypothetical protein